MSNYSTNRKEVEKNLEVLNELSREIGKPSLYHASQYADFPKWLANTFGSGNRQAVTRVMEKLYPLDDRVLDILPSIIELEKNIKTVGQHIDSVRSAIYKEGGKTELKYLEEITDCFSREKCRVSSEIANTYDSVSFSLLFPVKEYSVFREFNDLLTSLKLTKQNKEKIWWYLQTGDKEPDYFQRDNKAIFESVKFDNLVKLCKQLNDNLAPLHKRGFNAYLHLEDITSSNAKFTVRVSAAR